MQRDAEPNVMFPVEQEKADYEVAGIPGQYTHAAALAVAEDVVRTSPHLRVKIYRLDSIVELINGVVCVRGRE